eukprot:m.337120 g.337120  ORF g.337120 m.337120 type:complete len:198 (-) comp18054_c0_seq1:1371-1964(-)
MSARGTQKAENFKALGNQAFKKGKMKIAVDEYTKAIESLRADCDLDGEACDENVKKMGSVLFSNRSAAYLGMEKDEDAKMQLAYLFGASDMSIVEVMWSGEVLKSLDSAEQDASSAILYDPDNAKAYFRKGMSKLELVLRDEDHNAIEKLKDALKAFEKSDSLKTSTAAQAKATATRALIEEKHKMGNVKPFLEKDS